MERHSCSLKFQEELFQIDGVSNCYRSGKQAFALANIASENGLAHQPQIEFRRISYHLAVKRWVAVGECDRKAKFACIEVRGVLDARNKELRLDRIENCA